jgi:hypothetical protein
MRRVLAVVGATGLALLGVACGTAGQESSTDASANYGAATPAGATQAAAPGDAAAGGGAEAAVAADEATGSVLAGISESRVVQTASLGLSVLRGRFDETVSQARVVATGSGGFVASSSASQGRQGRLVRGSLVLRVPADAYGRTMTRLSDLGRITSREESGQDVSGEFVDLEARQRHLEAVEAQLLGFLKRTETIPEALAVQRRLDDVQLQLEEVRGRLAYLGDQTAFATITLQIVERGTPVAPPGDGDWGIADAWGAAADGLLKVVGGALVALVVAGPILLVLAAALLTGRIVFRRRRAHREAGSALG